MNLRWPASDDNCLLPWYKIAWRCPFALPIYFGVSVIFVSVLAATLSLREARDVVG